MYRCPTLSSVIEVGWHYIFCTDIADREDVKILNQEYHIFGAYYFDIENYFSYKTS